MSAKGRILSELCAEISEQTGALFLPDFSAKTLTTIKTGGPLQLFVPENITQLTALLSSLKTAGVEPEVCGAGSNLLIADLGISRPVIKLGSGFKFLDRISETVVSVGGARGLMRFSRETARMGLSGLEFAGGIPASVGGAVRMNAGAHRGEIAGVLASIECVDRSGRVLQISAEELRFGYRSNSLDPMLIITAAQFKLVPGDAQTISMLQQKHLDYRKKTQPLHLPSFGSVFVNPDPEQHIYAGALIEQAGLKDYQTECGARISGLHANWIVNPEKNASSKGIESLIATVRAKVFRQSKTRLQTEVVILR